MGLKPVLYLMWEYCFLAQTLKMIMLKRFLEGKTQFQEECNYRKDTENLNHAFVYSLNTSFQYLSIHTMSFIACYNYMI